MQTTNSSLMKRLVNNLVRSKVITTQRVADAMAKVDRGHFWGEGDEEAYEDCPQGIGCNVTISAPHMHAYCLEWT